MKIAAIAATVTALTLAACGGTEAEAAEIGNTGISIGAELDNRYNVDNEAMSITLTPEVGYSISGFALSASTDLPIVMDNEWMLDDIRKPILDFGAEYGLTMWGLGATAYAETGYDLEESDMSDVEVGVSFKF